jgi:hypothetical protein
MSRFGVGKEAPAPRFFNGVEDTGRGMGLILVGLAFLGPAVIVLALCPLRPAVRAWLFGFWAPLLLALLFTFGANSIWDGLFIGAVWYTVLGFRWLRAQYRAVEFSQAAPA